jgi:phospholipase/carboxylesterase
MKQGKAIEASLQHLVYFPDQITPEPATVVALHGRGADEYDLPPLLESLGFRNLLVISPRAPRPFEFGGGYAWYDLSEEGIPHPQTFNESLKLLGRFLVEIKKGYAINPSRLILLGFSQGAVMSYAAGLLDPTSIRGIVALSGFVPHRSKLPLRWDSVTDLPVFISHGTYDELMPIGLGRESAQMLRDAAAAVTFHEYPMGHQVAEGTLHDLTSWMREILQFKQSSDSK